MRPINVSLDSTTWEMAKQKPNFSEWIRNKLHEEYNKNQQTLPKPWKYCPHCYHSNNSPLTMCPQCPDPIVMVSHSELIGMDLHLHPKVHQLIDHETNAI